jgi:5-formyltetrahydrofolate cyclo-ligase
MSEDSLDSRKAMARQSARARRLAGADPQAAHLLVRTFPPSLAGLGVVAGYWPLGSEIDPRPLMLALGEAGAPLALPRVDERDGPFTFRRWQDGDPLSPDAFGILSPLPESEVVKPAVVLTPLLAFDRAGRRLGQGGGHYDRVLAALKPQGVLAVGLAYAIQEADVPAGPLDQKLDWIVTEREAIRA